MLKITDMASTKHNWTAEWDNALQELSFSPETDIAGLSSVRLLYPRSGGLQLSPTYIPPNSQLITLEGRTGLLGKRENGERRARAEEERGREREEREREREKQEGEEKAREERGRDEKTDTHR